MDPTINLCRIKNPTGPTEGLPKYSEPITDLQSNIQTSTEKTLPPKYVDVEKYLKIQSMRNANHLDNYDILRTRLNPFERTGRSIFANRAAMKLAGLDALFNFTGHTGGFVRYSTYGQFTFCDLASGPGAFTQYVHWRRPDSFGYGITLRGSLDWNPEIYDRTRFQPIYGPSDTGNLYTEWRYFADKVRETEVYGVDLVMGDGGFNVDDEIDPYKRELLSSRLILTQMMTALAVVTTGGTFVLKLFRTVNEINAQLIYLMALAFDEITIMKPMASRPANAERYLVCRGARSEDIRKPIIELMSEANEAYTEEETVVSLVEKVSPEFARWLTESNTFHLDKQWEMIQEIYEYAKRPFKIVPKYDLVKAVAMWNLPDTPAK